MGVCRFWRNAISSTPSLRTEVDLTSTGSSSQIYRLLHHFTRLSSLSQDNLLNASFDISYFVLEFCKELNPIIGLSGIEVLMDILQKSSSSFRQISFKASRLDRENCYLEMILHVFGKLQTFPDLRSIKFELPLPLTLITGNDLPHSKNFNLIYPDRAFRIEEIADVISLLKEIYNFTKSEFKSHQDSYWGRSLDVGTADYESTRYFFVNSTGIRFELLLVIMEIQSKTFLWAARTLLLWRWTSVTWTV